MMQLTVAYSTNVDLPVFFLATSYSLTSLTNVHKEKVQ